MHIINTLFGKPKKQNIFAEQNSTSANMQKVYYVKGWPHNGFGFLLKVKHSGIFVVKDKDTGKIIKCDRIISIDECIKNKQRVVDELSQQNLSPNMQQIYYQNKFQLDEAKYFKEN